MASMDSLLLGAPGDSGSLVVDMNRNPVALLFAGGGGQTLCNHIDLVLTALDAALNSIVGNPSGTTLAVDSSPASTIGKEARSTPNSP